MTYDPTRTKTLRDRYAARLRGMGNELATDIVRWLENPQNWLSEALPIEADTIDADSLERLTDNATGPSKWSLAPARQVLSAFTRWLNKRTDSSLPKNEQVHVDSDGFVSKAYDAGGVRAQSFNVPQTPDEMGGGFQMSFRTGTFIERLKILRTQARQQITGMSNQLKKRAIDLMTEGLISGKSPREIGRDMVKAIRKLTKTTATRIARTEVIRAHAEGTLDHLEALGVTEVGVEVEFTATMVDEGVFESRVCPKCRALHGNIYKIDQAHGIIPVHPNCRCAFLPAVDSANRNKTRKAVAATK